MTKYWVSWIQNLDKLGEFELHSPWWSTGFDEEDNFTICAAVVAENEHEAKEKVYQSYDVRPENLDFRFVSKRKDDWSPFSERFPKAKWMEACWND